jgi:hypothetical protein
MFLKGKAFNEEIGESYLICALAKCGSFLYTRVGLWLKIKKQYILLRINKYSA